MSLPAETVVLVGASADPERYAHKAFASLRKHGHRVIPVHPTLPSVEEVPVVPTLAEVAGPVDTVTLYVGARISDTLEQALVNLRPRRVIYNPGAENPGLAERLAAHGIGGEEACTLVLLATGQF